MRRLQVQEQNALLRFPALIALSLFVSGCAAVPVPLKIASWAADGISYMFTQKSVLDHGLSAMNGKDCAVMRLATGKKACQDNVALGQAFQDVSSTSLRPANQDTPAGPGFVPTTLACDAPRVSNAMPSDPDLYRCAELLIYQTGHTGALVQSEQRIASFEREQDADGVKVWNGVRLAVIDLANVAQVPR